MKAQDRAKAKRHAPIVALADMLRRTGPEQLDDLLETPLEDPDQIRHVRQQLELLNEAAGAAVAHLRELEEGIGRGDVVP